MAVLNAENFVNTRAIKELLIKGASRDIKDNEGKSAADNIRCLTDETLKKDLDGLLQKQPHYLPCCHLR